MDDPVGLTALAALLQHNDKYKHLKDVVRTYLGSKGALSLSRRSWCLVHFFIRAGFLVLNTAYVVRTVGTAGTCPGDSVNCVFFKLVAWSECVVVCFSLLRVVCDLFFIYYRVEWWLSVPVLIDNMQIASSFSLLEFLPVPSKVEYWFDHSARLLRTYVTHPPQLGGTFIFTLDIYGNLKSTYPDASFCFLAVAWVFVFLSMFFVQCLVPFCLVSFVVLSFPAFIVKVSTLANVHQLSTWGWHELVSCFGVLNQMSKMWDVSQIEKCAVFRYATQLRYPVAEKYGEVNAEKLAQLDAEATVKLCNAAPSKMEAVLLWGSLGARSFAVLFQYLCEDWES